jgi:small subunit ribosomal protein S21
MTRIEVRKDEPIDKALRRFKGKLRKEGLIDEMKKKEFYQKPSEQRRTALEKAVRREIRRTSKQEI